MSETAAPKFRTRAPRPGYYVTFDGRRTAGFVVRPDFRPGWSARRADGSFVGIFPTRSAAAEALR